MGPYQRTPKKVTRAIKYPGLRVRSVGPVGDFLETVGVIGFVHMFFLPIKKHLLEHSRPSCENHAVGLSSLSFRSLGVTGYAPFGWCNNQAPKLGNNRGHTDIVGSKPSVAFKTVANPAMD